MSSLIKDLTVFCVPCQTSNSSNISSFLEILIVSKLVSPYVSSLRDSFDLEFFDTKPLPTAIILLSFLFIVEASEYFS